MVHASQGVHECIIVLDGLKPDFNIGKIIRSADAFGIKEVHLTRVEYFDPEPAKGSFRWVVFYQHQDFAACYGHLQGRGFTLYSMVADGSHMLGRETLPDKVVFIFGHEEFGVSFTESEYPDIKPLTIQQWGRVQSLNVSVAASVAMFEYTRQHGRQDIEPPARTPSWSRDEK